MSSGSRRDFLAASGKVFVGTVAMSTIVGQAQAAAMEKSPDAGHGIAVDASATDTCGTCGFWGGMRKVSDDGTQVIAQSMGWCNNPKSMSHRKLTAADRKMKKPGIWQKWTVL